VRTTVTLDNDAFAAAKALAAQEKISLGAALSELVRRGLRPAGVQTDALFPTFAVSADARPITPADVQAALDDE